MLSLPTERLRAGDFSNTGTVIYDPATFDASTGRRQPFPNNMIPRERFNSVTKYFLDTFVPVPVGSAITNNYVSNPTQIQNIDQISARYDRDFSGTDSITARYTRNRYTALLPRGDSGVATPLPGLGEDVTLYGQNVKIGWMHTFNNSTLNSLTFGFSQYFRTASTRRPDKAISRRPECRG